MDSSTHSLELKIESYTSRIFFGGGAWGPSYRFNQIKNMFLLKNFIGIYPHNITGGYLHLYESFLRALIFHLNK